METNKAKNLISNITTAISLSKDGVILVDVQNIQLRLKGTLAPVKILLLQVHDNQLQMLVSGYKLYNIEPNTLPMRVLEKLHKICVATNPEISFEYCPFCENEAIIPYKMEMGVCNHCGKPLAPCSYCIDLNHGDCPECSGCKFNQHCDQDDDNEEEDDFPVIIGITIF